MLSTWDYLLAILMILTAVFLILLILVQRGRGGGLAGALGGMGGQSAFGTKAGDLFTRITVVTALFWVVLLVISVKVMGGGKNRIDVTGAPPTGVSESSKTGDGKKLAEEESTGKATEGKASDTKAGDTKAGEAKSTESSAPSAAGPSTDAGASAPAATPPAGGDAPTSDEAKK